MAVALACAGAEVFLTGRREEKLLETIEEASLMGADATNLYTVVADITDPVQVKKASEEIGGMRPILNGLVNNAALPTPGGVSNPLNELSLNQWEAIIRTNVTSHWLVTKQIIPSMLRGGSPRILFITSEAGWAFTTGYGPYNISKAALNNLACSMATEYASAYPDKDVQMNVLVPGEAKTEMNQGSEESPYEIVKMALTLLSQPMGGPNGMFFHRDGRSLQFCYAMPYGKPLK